MGSDSRRAVCSQWGVVRVGKRNGHSNGNVLLIAAIVALLPLSVVGAISSLSSNVRTAPAATVATAAPPRPARPRAAVARIRSSSVKITWTKVRRARRYEVRMRRTGKSWGTPRKARGRSAHVFHKLHPRTNYRFQVRACRGTTCGRWSRSVRARTKRRAFVSGDVGGCALFPSSNAWHQDISKLPRNPRSDAWVRSIGSNSTLHPDFGSNIDYGIPFVVVPSGQRRVPIEYTAYGDESDPGPFPIPADAPIEGGASSDGDRHVLVVEGAPTCRLFELYRSFAQNGGGWNADSGATWDLSSNALRPDGWTSTDAAGLPVLAGLVRYDEVKAGHIDHAIRFTVEDSQAGYITPARHLASDNSDPNLPPMGARFRLKSSFDISGYPADARVILKAMKTYGLIVADNGGDWFFQGASDSRWNDETLSTLKDVPGSAFEAVDSGPVKH